MNLIAATMLSTKRKAYSLYRQHIMLFLYKLQYVFVVEEMQDSNEKTYFLQIYHVTYPDENKEGQGLGKPRRAERPHFEKECSFEELKTFLKEREFSLDDGWFPVEDDVEIVQSAMVDADPAIGG